MINVTFLGTADSIPSAARNHSAILLTYYGENILIDCGEGTQRQFRKARLNPMKITRILITHWHSDHVLGLPGLLQTMNLSGYNKTLFIYGPKGTKSLLNSLLKLFAINPKFKIEVKEVNGKFLDEKEFYLESKKMVHGTICNAYSFVKKGLIRIDKKKLAKTKLPIGPLMQKLKLGKNISHKGKKYLAKNLTYKEEDKKITVILDTALNNNAISLAKNSDLLICEASFEADLKDRAKEFKHLTSDQAAQIAKKAKSKKLILTHISQRYNQNKKKLLDEAKKVFKNSQLVKDLDVISIK
jgi:ribonuclease Z